MRIEYETDCTQREFIADVAWKIYQSMGYTAPTPVADLMYFFRSQHPMERACVQGAEDLFEMLTGDTPDYSDEEECDEPD